MHLTRTTFIAPLLSCIVLSGCFGDEQRIKDALADANHCETVDDCADIGSKCPFGCSIYVHKDKAEEMKALVDGFESRCVYGCAQSFGVECTDHRCSPILEEPRLLDGNAGAACTSDDECQTPVSYLVRSNCPFGSLCIDNICRVVCPVDFGSGPTEKRCQEDGDCDCRGYAANDKENCKCVKNACVAVMAME